MVSEMYDMALDLRGRGFYKSERSFSCSSCILSGCKSLEEDFMLFQMRDLEDCGERGSAARLSWKSLT